jgi:hypothetical protein
MCNARGAMKLFWMRRSAGGQMNFVNLTLVVGEACWLVEFAPSRAIDFGMTRSYKYRNINK